MTKRVTEPANAEEARRIRDALKVLLKQQRFPYGIKQFDLEFREDATGDPAVFISFPIEDDLSPSREKASNLHKLVRQVQNIVREQGVSRWPYVRFRAAH